MRRTSLSVLILTIGLIASACGGGDGSESGSGDTTTTAPTTTTIPPASADKAKAQAIVLTQADVGAGFTPDTDTADENTPEADKAFRDCSQNNPVLISESEERSAESEFKQGELTNVTSEVEFWTNEAELKAAMDILATDAFATCVNGAFSKLFADMGTAQGATIGNIKTTKKAVTVAGTDQATGLTTSLTISAGGQRLNLFIDMVFMRKGRAGAALMAMAAQRAFPEAEMTRLTGILAQRLVANAA